MGNASKLRTPLYAFCLCSIGVCVGLNWTALQLVAWTGMALENAHNMKLSLAVEKAVEGQQTCVICRLLNEKQKTKPDSPLNKLNSGIELKAVLKEDKIVLVAFHDFEIRFGVLIGPITFLDSPPSPPPQESV